MDRKRLLRNPLLWILAALILYYSFSLLLDDTRGFSQVQTSTALAQISDGNVKDAVIEDKEQRLRMTLLRPIDAGGTQATQVLSQYPAGLSDEIVQSLQQAPNKPIFNTKVSQDSFLVQLLIYLVPLGLVLLILFWMMNNAQGGGNRVLSFGKSRAK
jgi:cell division protease FtsH